MILNKTKHNQSPDFRLAMEFREKAKRKHTVQDTKILWQIAFDYIQRYRESLTKKKAS